MYNRLALMAALSCLSLDSLSAIAITSNDDKGEAILGTGLPLGNNDRVRRITSDSKEGKQFLSQNTNLLKNVSDSKPHIGAKQKHKGHKAIGIKDANCSYCFPALSVKELALNESCAG